MAPVVCTPEAERRQFIIGAGRGNTGTHALHKYWCKRGRRSNHEKAWCNFDGLAAVKGSSTRGRRPNGINVDVFHASGLGPLYNSTRIFRRQVDRQEAYPFPLAVWVDRFREDVLRLSRAVSTNLGAGLIGDTPVPSFFGELRRLNPRAPVVHLVRLEAEGRVWVEHRARAGHLEHDVVCRPEFAVANPFDILECAALGLRLGKKAVADMFRTAAAINDTAVLARAYMGYVESVRRVEPRLLAEIDIFACRGRVGGKEVVFKSVDGRCKVSSVGAAVEELVDRSRKRH